MHWLNSRGKAAAVLGLGGLLITSLGLGLADSAQAAGSHNIMVRKSNGWDTGSVTVAVPGGAQSRCTRVQNDIYNSTNFQVPEGTHLIVRTYDDANCQQAGPYFVVSVPNGLTTSNWWFTI